MRLSVLPGATEAFAFRESALDEDDFRYWPELSAFELHHQKSQAGRGDVPVVRRVRCQVSRLFKSMPVISDTRQRRSTWVLDDMNINAALCLCENHS